MYAPGLLACTGAPFIYCAPHYFQTSPAPALIFTYNVHELPADIPRQVYVEVGYISIYDIDLHPKINFFFVNKSLTLIINSILLPSSVVLAVLQVVCSLAISENSWLFPDGQPTAMIYFCPPTGDGAVFKLKLDRQRREEWAQWSFAAVKFFLSSMLPRLLRGRRYSDVNYSSPSPAKTQAAALLAPPPDQTPAVKVGKVVEDPKRKGRRGVVKELKLDGTKPDRVIVEWDGEESLRKKPHAVKNLKVVPHLNIERVMPTRRGDRVVVYGTTTRGLEGKEGVVEKYNAKQCSVVIDGVVLRISTSNLHCLDGAREVTIPASTDCFMVPLAALEKMNDNINRSRSLKLIGGPSITKFVATAKERTQKLVERTSKEKKKTRRRKKKLQK